MAQHIKTILSSILTQSHDWRLALLRDWPTIVGDLAGHLFLEKIDNDTLILRVEDACWMHELYMLSPLLLKTINKKLDQPRIKKLRFKQKGIDKKRVTTSKPQQHKGLTEPVISAQESRALVTIKDPQLQMALKQFLYRCQREK